MIFPLVERVGDRSVTRVGKNGHTPLPPHVPTVRPGEAPLALGWRAGCGVLWRATAPAGGRPGHAGAASHAGVAEVGCVLRRATG
jgi:hypothetical protein